jgi:hypothetical protein
MFAHFQLNVLDQSLLSKQVLFYLSTSNFLLKYYKRELKDVQNPESPSNQVLFFLSHLNVMSHVVID